MTEQNNNNLSGRVYALEENLTGLSKQVAEGFRNLGERFEGFASNTDRRFENIAQSQLQAVTDRSQSYWQIIVSAGGGLIAAAALAVSIYSLTKEPITDKFNRQEKDITRLEENTVPVPEVRLLERQLEKNTDKLGTLSEKLSSVSALQQQDEANFNRIDMALKDATSKFVQTSRVDLLSTRVQTIYDKFFALPAVPCIGAGCGKSIEGPPQAR